MAILKKLFIYAVAAMSLSSCYTNFDPYENDKPVLCLNAVITADEPMTIYVNHTHRYTDGYHYYGTDDFYVKDATVKLYINDQYVEDLVYSEWEGYNTVGSRITYGGYKSTYEPKQGERVRIVATSAEYGEAIGEETMPIAVPIDNVELVPTLNASYTTNFYQDDDYKFNALVFEARASVRFTDPGDELNYYTAEITPSLPAELEDEKHTVDEEGNEHDEVIAYFLAYDLDYDTEPLFAEHISTLELLMGGDSYGCNYFSDNQISGKPYTLNLHYSRINYFKRVAYKKDLAYHLTMNVKLGSVSQSYYYWQLYNWKRDNSIQGQLSDIGMSEQLIPYSNVSTGAGVICTRSYATYPVDLADFIKSSIVQE